MIRFVPSLLLLAAWTIPAGAADEHVLRGRLRQDPGKPPVIETSEGKTFTVSGDKFLEAQMADPKLKGRDVELEGKAAGPGRWEASHLFLMQDGKRYKATYWCDICSIRTHMPGRCMCCQADTELQLIPVP